MGTSELDSVLQLMQMLKISKLLSLFLGLFILWLIANTFHHIGSRLNKHFPSKRILILQIITVLNFFLYIFGGFILIYGILDPPKELMIAVGGSAAVAIGFSLKDLVSSLVAGVILLFDRPFQVGDRVTFGDTYGEITSIGLRAVRLTTLDDNLVTIPNSRFITDVVASGNAGALDMMVCVDFYLGLDADLHLAKSIVQEILLTSRYIYLKKDISISFSEKIVGHRLMIELKAKAYVLDVKFEKAFQTDVVMRTEKEFLKQQIKRPIIINI